MSELAREKLKAKKQAYVQDEITASASELFAERGYRSVTIDDIASSLGYTKSVVYYYFKNKNEVLWTIFEKITDAWKHDMEDILSEDMPPVEMLSAMIKKHTLNVLERTAWTAIWYREQGQLSEEQQKIVTARRKSYNDKFKMVYKKGVDEGVFQDVPVNLVVGGIIGVSNWTHDWYQHGGELRPEEIANQFANLLINGCLVRD